MLRFEISAPDEDGVRVVTARLGDEFFAHIGYIAYDMGWWEGNPTPVENDGYIFRCTSMGAVLDCLIEQAVSDGVTQDYY